MVLFLLEAETSEPKKQASSCVVPPGVEAVAAVDAGVRRIGAREVVFQAFLCEV